MTPSEHGSESPIVPWYHISHQGKLECLVESCFGMNCLSQSDRLGRAQVKNKSTGISMVRFFNLVSERRQLFSYTAFVISLKLSRISEIDLSKDDSCS